jgi:hypothetical protein
VSEEAATAVETVKKPLLWDGKEVVPAEVSVAVLRASRKMSVEDGTWHIMINSLRYKETKKRVFIDEGALNDVGSKKQLLLMKLAKACVEFVHKPDDPDDEEDSPLG